MQDEKFKKIVVGATVAAVLLIVFLVIFLTCQMISISARKNREQELIAKIEECKASIQNAESDIDVYKSRVWLEMAARELGMKSPGDIDWGLIIGDGESVGELTFYLDQNGDEA